MVARSRRATAKADNKPKSKQQLRRDLDKSLEAMKKVIRENREWLKEMAEK